jgi:hypothetical protein
MTEVFDQDLIAPCGMNCGICVSYLGYTMDGNKKKVDLHWL